MKLLFDQNISHRIFRLLPEKFSGSTTVKREKLINADDRAIWDLAKKQSYTIVTQDSDFNDLNLLLGFPPKLIWIRTGNLGTQAILRTLLSYSEELEKFISDDSYGCFEIVKTRKKE